ncbi:hypothetical protein FE257_009304 [Aspergillus nanangensis]|uniref:Cytochrome P450 n=1 Tax=Aspergillus nanangensis TaxID=2582783 RepID=A0AAD4GSX3_ASPNN|nr:hypothetical protein FE257_009304 [Aspergillus nanangensis]
MLTTMSFVYVPSLFTAPLAATLFSCVLLYMLYMRCIHPLSRFPGPVKASLTNGWKAYWVYKGVLHERLVHLHNKYGPVVRIGPNHLHIWSEEAISPIYKAGRMMGKTEFYDAFTAFNPNLFGGTDENIHSLRRRQLSHGFSQASIEKLQPLINTQLEILLQNLHRYAETGETFDLKEIISLYVLDILGEVAFSRSFGAQLTGKAEQIPAINDHLLLSCVIGELPFQNLLKALARWSPVPWMRRLVQSRNNLKRVCAESVRYKMAHPSERRDLLQSLVEARDSETGAALSEQEINSEAFSMLVAGSHSTTGTLTLLLWHLLHNPKIRERVQDEIQEVLGPLSTEKKAYPIQGLEASLPYTMACVRENFRMNPVFTMPLWRRVNSPAGVQIGNVHIPHGTNICISNYVLHHNPDIWGTDHAVFNPERWLKMDEESKAKARCLIPFSVGHRMCIGRNLGMTNILKTATTLLSWFELEPVEREKMVRLKSSGIGEMEGAFLCRVSLRDARHLPLDVWYMVAEILHHRTKLPSNEYESGDWKREALSEYFPNLRDLVNLSSTCSWFRNLLAPRIFAFVVLRNTTKSALSIEAVSKGNWASCVKELRYIGISEIDHTIENVYPPEVDKILSNLAQFRDLQSVTVQFPVNYEDLYYDGLFQDEFDPDPANALVAEKDSASRGLMLASFRAIISNYNSGSQQLPRSLTIHDLNLATVSIFSTQVFRDFLSHLQTFNLSLTAWDNGAGWNLNTQEIFYGLPDQLGPWFFNHLSSVQEFSFDARSSSRLGAGGQDSRSHDISLRNATMPHLRKVTLEHIIICKELVDFLVRNIATLESIVLKNCFAMLNDSEAHSTGWCDFFTALARQNPLRLRSFQLICENDKDDMLDLDFTYNDPQWDPNPHSLAQARNKLETEPQAHVFPYGYLDDKYGFGYRSHIDNQTAFVAGADERAYRELVDLMTRNAPGSVLHEIQYPEPGDEYN